MNSADTSGLTALKSVLIPVGQASVSFHIDVVHDYRIIGDKTIALTAMADTYISAKMTFSVLEVDKASLSLSLDRYEANEGESIALTVSRDWITDEQLLVYCPSQKKLGRN